MEKNFYPNILVMYLISQLPLKRFFVMPCNDSWKVVKPLYEEGSLTLPRNCRPVSLLPLIFKSREKDYLRSNTHYSKLEEIIIHL